MSVYQGINIKHYYSFGAVMPGRVTPFQTSVDGMSDGSASYRYGFNGKENDFEPKNSQGSQQDYGMRIYDPRLGRFLSVDPLTKSYPELSPFAFAENTPIMAIDLDGEEKYYFQRKFDNATGKTSLVITGKEDIYEKVYSIEISPNGIPNIVYTTVKNSRVELVESITVERPIESVYGLTWYTYEEEVAYENIEDAINGTNGHYTDKHEGSRLAHYAIQGLNNVAIEIRINGGPIAKSQHGKSSNITYKGIGALRGSAYENYLVKNLKGGSGSFKKGGREFDGSYNFGKTWFEAKSGNYWKDVTSSKAGFAKFKSDMGDRLRIAKESGAEYELFSNSPIPDNVKSFLNTKNIKFTETLE